MFHNNVLMLIIFYKCVRCKLKYLPNDEGGIETLLFRYFFFLHNGFDSGKLKAHEQKLTQTDNQPIFR